MQERSKGWPRAESASEYAACDFCDTLQKVVPLMEGDSAHCRTCGAALYENRPRSLQRTISFALTALFLMGLVVIFPFLTLNNAGFTNSMTVWGAAGNLWRQGEAFMAIATASFIVVLPLILIFCLLYVTCPLVVGRSLPGAVRAFRIVNQLQAWVMVEVFFLGAMVSLLKLVKVAEVTMGEGFWAFALLILMMAGAFSSIDRVEFWDRIEAARERRKERPV